MFQFEKEHSPLLKDLLLCLKEMMQDFRSEVNGESRGEGGGGRERGSKWGEGGRIGKERSAM